MKDLPNILPVITLYQPWATWIMRGWKTIETRVHDRFETLKNKDILIHAGMKTDEAAAQNTYLTREQILENPDEVINGYILGSAFVYDFKKLEVCHSQNALIDCGSTLRYGLFLRDIKKINPIPAKGSMGIWYYDLENKEKVVLSSLVRQEKWLT